MKIYAFLFFVFTTCSIFSQTNIFPDNGRVGIQTIDPETWLHIKSGSSLHNTLFDGNSLTFKTTNNGTSFINKQDNGALSFRVGENNFSVMLLSSKSKNIGIGTTAPHVRSKLHVNNNYSTSDYKYSRTALKSTLTANIDKDTISYDKSIYSGLIYYSIPNGVRDSGYKIGVDGSAYSGYDVFAGSLKHSWGVWARAGIYKATAGASIDYAIGLNAEVLSHAAGATIQNAYGVKISTARSNATTVNNKYDLYAETPDAKNYFAGTLGIGTTNMSDSTGNYRLSVKGKVRANEVKVYTGWADFVFEKDYNLPTLQEVEQHIEEKGHLKDIPNAKDVEKNGVYLGEMNAKLLQKIEELTLYTIQQEKDIESLNLVKIENQLLKQRVEKLEKLVEKLIEN